MGIWDYVHKILLFLLLIKKCMNISQFCMIPYCLQCAQDNPYLCTQCLSISSLQHIQNNNLINIYNVSNTNNQIINCCSTLCNKCQNQTQCLSCITGYSLVSYQNGNLCQLQLSCLQPGCVVCSLYSQNQSYQQGICILCQSGMVLNTFTLQCLFCPANCQICNINKQCQICNIGYYLNNDNECFLCTLSPCLICVSQLQCVKCPAGTTLAASFPACTSCINHCLICSNQSTCDVCNSGYYLSLPQLRCHACSSSCEYCYGTSTNCTACNSHNYLSMIQQTGQMICLACFISIPYCQSCLLTTQATVVCIACDSGKFVFQNVCKLCSTGCNMCSNQSLCTSCLNGFYLKSYSNKSANCQRCIPHCVECVNNQTCNACAGYFYQINSSKSACVPCPQNCIQFYYVNNTCKYCFFGYYVVGSQCLACSPNCATCQMRPDNCSSCMNTFFVQKIKIYENVYVSQCLPCPLYCKVCQNVSFCSACTGPNYMIIEGFCILCNIQNCQECVVNVTQTLCLLCSTSFYLSEDLTTCLPCPIGCSICYSNMSCTQCMNGYQIDVHQFCFQCSTNCDVCLTPTICVQCAQKYYPISSQSQSATQCLPCSTGCQECLSYFNCLSCDFGYYLESINNSTIYSIQNNGMIGFCYRCIQPCLTCTSSAHACISCIIGYSMIVQGICRKCSLNCIDCDFNGNCKNCADGYAPHLVISNQQNQTNIQMLIQCSPCPLQCIKCMSILDHFGRNTAYSCIQCPFDMILLQNSTCFRCGSSASTQGCTQCNNEMQPSCIVCQSGFTLNWTTSSGGICVNQNIQKLAYSQQGLIGALIGLGCLIMVLLITLLIIKTRTNKKMTGYTSQLQTIIN